MSLTPFRTLCYCTLLVTPVTGNFIREVTMRLTLRFILAALLVGCGNEVTEPPRLTGSPEHQYANASFCRADSDCRGGTVCRANRCVALSHHPGGEGLAH